MEILLETYIYAIVGGLIPSFIWMWFWLREDSAHPEPKSLIIAVFIGGMLMAPIAIQLEVPVAEYFRLNYDVDYSMLIGNFTFLAIALLFVLAAIEEILKYLGANIVAFHNRNLDEPIDIMVYLITAALGFAAFENILFIIKFITVDSLSYDLIMVNGDLRFIGAVLLHVVTSGIFGGIMALAFYKKTIIKILYTIIGLTTATVLHTMFNFFIINSEGFPIKVFSVLWITSIVLILLFEKVKRITK